MPDKPMPTEGGWSLLVSFPDESPSFTYGFQAGQIWERMRSGRTAHFAIETHTENREVIQRMATAEGWEITRTPTEVPGWDHTEFDKVRSAPETPNPHGLRIVSDERPAIRSREAAHDTD